MKTRYYTFSELATFIHNQRDDRPIVMQSGQDSYDCGCVLTHFGRFVSKRKIDAPGLTTIKTDRNELIIVTGPTYGFINELITKNVTKYKQVKKILEKYV